MVTKVFGRASGVVGGALLCSPDTTNRLAKGVAWQIDTWASKLTLAVDDHQVVYLSVRFAKIRVYERHMEHLETPKCGHLTSFDVAWII